MKRGCLNNRGVSPVIASVLLVLLVVILSLMVFLWAKGFVTEQIEKFGKPIDQQCAAINFDVARSGNSLKIVNRGNIDIGSFDIKLKQGGTTEVKNFNFDVPAGDAVDQAVTLTMADGSKPDVITVYPTLIGTVVGAESNKIYTCVDQGVIL